MNTNNTENKPTLNTISITTRISNELYKMVIAAARQTGLKQTDIIRNAISEYVQKKS
jgi:predicted DNA-binding protein